MRKRLFEIIEVSKNGDILSLVYDIFMIISIIISIIPLAFTSNNIIFSIIDKITLIIFIFDYFFRYITADFKIQKGKFSFILYPITPFAIIDLLSILPSLSLLSKGWKILKIFRLLKTFKIFKIFKAFRYSKNIKIFISVFKKQRDSLLTIFGVAIIYILISALVILNVEPQTFNNYFDAIYWATVSLTTVGYGDIYPISIYGKIITMISSFIGIAIIAMPAGVITAGFMEEIKKGENKNDSC